MKIQIEVDPQLTRNEIVLRCGELNQDILDLQQRITELCNSKESILFYQGEKEYYFPVRQVLFFETSQEGIKAHTASDVFHVKYKLYELEELVPAYFLRVSKSTILNTREIYSITKNITASSVVEFQSTHKKVYVSRNYYKALRGTMENNRRIG